MNMNKRLLLFLIIVLTITTLVLTGCTSRFEDVSIEVNNVKDVKEGEYTLEYKINNYERYVNTLSLKVYIWVYDSENNTVEVVNNRTINVKKDETYTVRITVTGFERYKEKSITAMYTINAEDDLPLVSFILSDSDIDSTNTTSERYDIYYREYSPIEKGGSLSYDIVVPTLNLSDTSSLEYKYYVTDFTSSKYSREFIGYRWVVYNSKNEEEVLTQDHLNNITEDLHIYCIVTWKYNMYSYTITIDSNGGTAFSPITGPYGTVINRISTPQKAGYAFLGWCKDEECTKFINWSIKPMITSDATYYAAWEEIDNNTTDIGLFEFTEDTDSNGNVFYKIAGKAGLSGDIVLPNAYTKVTGDNPGVYPVSRFVDGGFMGNTGITSVYIPNTFTLVDTQAFLGCNGLISVTFENTNARMKQINSSAFAGCSSLINIALPSSLLRINISAFNACTSLEEVVLPENLNTIGHSAFASCTSIVNIVIPDSVVAIGKASFSNCTSLESVTFSSNSELASIENDAFNHCFKLDEIKLPKSLEESNIVLVKDSTAVDDDDKYIHIIFY